MSNCSLTCKLLDGKYKCTSSGNCIEPNIDDKKPMDKEKGNNNPRSLIYDILFAVTIVALILLWIIWRVHYREYANY